MFRLLVIVRKRILEYEILPHNQFVVHRMGGSTPDTLPEYYWFSMVYETGHRSYRSQEYRELKLAIIFSSKGAGDSIPVRPIQCRLKVQVGYPAVHGMTENCTLRITCWSCDRDS